MNNNLLQLELKQAKLQNQYNHLHKAVMRISTMCCDLYDMDVYTLIRTYESVENDLTMLKLGVEMQDDTEQTPE
jgi:hypothetical protein